MSEAPDDTVQLLHSLGYIYGEYGHRQRALVMLLLAARMAPENTGVLSTLAHVLLLDREADEALKVIEHLERLDSGEPILRLMKSRALWIRGDRDEARRAFRDYVDSRVKDKAS
jgi:type III secretion protein Y